MKVIVLGNGIHTKKRIIPALNKIEIIDSLTVADRNAVKDTKLSKSNQIVNYERELNNDNYYDLAIIATPPYNHIDSFLRIKDKSKIALIEKPLTNDFKFIFGKEMEGYLKSNKILESLMYFHHPVWGEVKNLLSTKKITSIRSEFSVPHGDKNSFRYIKKYGGGSLNDQGIYPISLVSELITKDYEIESIKIEKDKKYNVDLGGTIEINFNEISFTGKWGLGKEYKNYLVLKEASNKEYIINFFFSKPEDTKLKIEIKKDEDIEIGIFDQFELMYSNLLQENFSHFEYSSYENVITRYKLFKKIFDLANTK